MDLPINQIICGDCLEVMRDWPDNCVNCCVTSPPYWGLRDYGVDGQLGLEKTPEEFVAKMVAVFAEVKRVLRDDGTLWLNMGDSYAQGGKQATKAELAEDKQRAEDRNYSTEAYAGWNRAANTAVSGLKPKDLCGMPWRLAFALQADGWYLRQDIIWHKPNPMPESVRDRCTKAHEYIFLLTKKPRYYYDADAIRENNVDPARTNYAPGKRAYAEGNTEQCNTDRTRRNDGFEKYAQGEICNGRNKRSVWTVTTKPYSEAHFATFPPDLIRPCILAGCPKGGVVLDPFMGSGTVAEVAAIENRNYVGCELNQEYINLGRAQAVETGVPVKEARAGQMGLFNG